MSDILHLDGPAHSAVADCWNTIGVLGDASCPELATYTHCRNCPAYSAAASGFLDTELTGDYLQQCTEQVAQGKPLTGADQISIVVFRLGDEWFGLPTAILKEVVSVRSVHSVPHRRNGVLLGLSNIRGELLPCFSLQQVLGLDLADTSTAERPDKSHSVGGRLLVMSRENSRAVCHVSEVHGIVHFYPRDITPASATITKAAAAYTRSVLAWKEKMVGLLSDEMLFKSFNRNLA